MVRKKSVAFVRVAKMDRRPEPVCSAFAPYVAFLGIPLLAQAYKVGRASEDTGAPPHSLSIRNVPFRDFPAPTPFSPLPHPPSHPFVAQGRGEGWGESKAGFRTRLTQAGQKLTLGSIFHKKTAQQIGHCGNIARPTDAGSAHIALDPVP